MLKQGRYGYLERVSFFSFAFGMVGMALTVLLMNLFDERTQALWVLVVWFSPIPVCIACWWAIFSSNEFSGVCQFIAVFGFLGFIGGDPESLFLIPILIGFSFAWGFLHGPSRKIINWGRFSYRKV